MFSLLVHLIHLLWRTKMEVQENTTVHWHPKSTTAHLYEWEVRVHVDVREGARDVVMGATWDRRAHVLWVTGTPQVLPRVKRMFFGDNGAVGDVMRVVCRYVLSALHLELVGSREGGGM